MDRLTRFKSTEEKYLRVFKDILVSNLIFPKYKKNQLDAMPYEMLKNYAEKIFNYSCHAELVSASNQYNKPNRSRIEFGMTPSVIMSDFNVNKLLLEYEKSVFELNSETLNLLNNEINYVSAIKLFNENELPLNLKWMKGLIDGKNSFNQREKFALRFPIEKVVLTEGITEEILLPKFAKLCGYDFDKNGVQIISAGGKNQVVKLFYQYAEILKLPMFVLLDSDAMKNYSEIKHKLRNQDKVYIIEQGEFEDILPLNLIKRTLNSYLKNFSSVSLAELRQNKSMVAILEEIFKQKGFGEFKKAEFAQMIAKNILSMNDISDEIVKIVQKINLI